MSALELPARHPLVAYPGDDDLVFDVSCLHLAAWSEMDGSFVLRLIDGLGWWVGSDGLPTDIEHITECEMSLTIGPDQTMTDGSKSMATIAWLADAFGRWSPDVDLRLTSAPGRLSRLAASDDDWVCLPHRPYSGAPS